MVLSCYGCDILRPVDIGFVAQFRVLVCFIKPRYGRKVKNATRLMGQNIRFKLLSVPNVPAFHKVITHHFMAVSFKEFLGFASYEAEISCYEHAH